MNGKKILLIAPIHNYKNFVNQYIKTSNTEFPSNQGHYFWCKAIRELGYELDTFVYSDIPLLSPFNSGKILNFITSNIHTVYKVLDRFFYLFPYLSINNYFRNYLLLKKIKTHKYDVMFFSGGTTKIFGYTLKKIQNYGVKVVFFYGMSPLIFGNSFEKRYAREMNYIFTNDPIHAKEFFILGQDNSFDLPISSIDADLYNGDINFLDREYDIVFIGRLSPKKDYTRRIESLVSIKKHFGKRLFIWSSDTEILKKHDLFDLYQGQVFGDEMLKILKKSKISLNFHGNFMPGGGNMRTFEICGLGSFQIVDFVNDKWFDIGKELITFSNNDDLVSKIDFYLGNENERISIAKAGFEKVYAYHTYSKHFEQLFKKIGL